MLSPPLGKFHYRTVSTHWLQLLSHSLLDPLEGGPITPLKWLRQGYNKWLLHCISHGQFLLDIQKHLMRYLKHLSECGILPHPAWLTLLLHQGFLLVSPASSPWHLWPLMWEAWHPALWAPLFSIYPPLQGDFIQSHGWMMPTFASPGKSSPWTPGLNGKLLTWHLVCLEGHLDASGLNTSKAEYQL